MKTQIASWILLILLFFSISQSSAGPRERYASISEAYWSSHLEIGDTFTGSLELRTTVDGTETSKSDYSLNYEIIGDMSGNMWDASYNIFDDIDLKNGAEAINTINMVYYGISPINAVLDDSSEINFVGTLWEFLVVDDFQNPDNGVSLSIDTEGVMATYTGTLNYIDAVGELDGTVDTETGIVQSIMYTITSDDGTIETTQYNLLTSNANHGGTSTSSTGVSTNSTIALTSDQESNDDSLQIELITIISGLFILSYKKKRSD
ncbi:MAG: hypothetical protein GPJ54_17050 [Candidatus Heimdallarchaeota archaeon]|nr:hypothetical protein [Candidatus Heimdallarchaeota archaeon]